MNESLLDELTFVSINEICASSGLSMQDIDELIDLGVFVPSQERTQRLFSARTIELARLARRLQIDFDLSLEGVALALAYHERIRELEERLHRMECELPGRLHE